MLNLFMIDSNMMCVYVGGGEFGGAVLFALILQHICSEMEQGFSGSHLKDWKYLKIPESSDKFSDYSFCI